MNTNWNSDKQNLLEQVNRERIQYARVTYPLPVTTTSVKPVMSVLGAADGKWNEQIKEMRDFLQSIHNLKNLRELRKRNKPGYDALAYVNRRTDLVHLQRKRSKPGERITSRTLFYTNTYLLGRLRYALGVNEHGYANGFVKLQNKANEVNAALSVEGKLMVASLSLKGKVGLARFIQLPKIDDKGQLQINHYNLREAIVHHLGKTETTSPLYRLIPVNREPGEVSEYEDALHFNFQLDRTGAKLIATVSVQYLNPLELAAKMAANLSVPCMPGDRSQEVKDALAKVYALIPGVH